MWFLKIIAALVLGALFFLVCNQAGKWLYRATHRK